MRFTTLTAATTTALAVAQAAPINVDDAATKDVSNSKGFLDSLVDSISSLMESNEEAGAADPETPGEHWKHYAQQHKTDPTSLRKH